MYLSYFNVERTDVGCGVRGRAVVTKDLFLSLFYTHSVAVCP